MKPNRILIVEHIIKDLMNESDNIVMNNDERFHLEDYIEYTNKPGIVVAVIKGGKEYFIRQLPIGAIDNFRFMRVSDYNAIAEQDKNNGKSYDQILEDYENDKNQILGQWILNNKDKIDVLKTKYGDKLIGIDVVQNDKKIHSKELLNDKEEQTEKNNETNYTNIVKEKENDQNINNLDNDKELKEQFKDIANILKKNEDKLMGDELKNDIEDVLQDNVQFKKKIEEIQNIIGTDKPEQISQKKQSEVLKQLYKIQDQFPKKIKDTKWDNLKNYGISDVDKLKDDISKIQQKKQQIQNNDSNKNDDKKQLNEGLLSVLGLIFKGISGIFNLAWSALSLIWAEPMTAGALCLLFYILGKNKKN